ncbi:hypothetical protein GUJ93_ZPchr0003g18025 [Zizania palustris]|uniref:Uncharacterized protein n=1 Tax=Zizania palustris TaxID=103762 RepID=A0A8J5RVU6_ZIZPA|nr:hypothetical protein GUJ93_ZPchr0003g18025 [Zizania palustris]
MDVRACISLTDQFIHERITNERYQDAVMELEQHINGSINLDPSSIGSMVTLKDDTKIRAPKASYIAYEDESRLMLMREWSLLDSKELHVDASTANAKLLEHIDSPENSLDIPWEFTEANMKKVMHSCSSRFLFFGVFVADLVFYLAGCSNMAARIAFASRGSHRQNLYLFKRSRFEALFASIPFTMFATIYRVMFRYVGVVAFNSPT